MQDSEQHGAPNEASFTNYNDLFIKAKSDQPTEMPSPDTTETVEPVPEPQIQLEAQAQEIIEQNLDAKYRQMITGIQAEKVNWVNSAEFARRIKLTGAEDEDVVQIQQWVLGNIESGRVHVLMPDDMSVLKTIIRKYSESSGISNSIEQGSAFYVSETAKGVPAVTLGTAFVPDTSANEKPGFVMGGPKTEQLLRHELGHQAQDGVLESELFQNLELRFKETAPDKEYIGLLRETDTRIRAMFNVLAGLFDPQTTTFGHEHVQQLHEMRKGGSLNNDADVVDLLDHFDDEELIRLANTLPAI